MAVAARKSEPAHPSASERLASAQAAVEESIDKLCRLNARRNEYLLKDNDAEAAKLAAEIQELQQLADGHRDKVALLKQAAAEEERARRAKEQAALVGRIEAKLELRDKAMDEVAAAVKQLTVASDKAIKLGREIVAAWSWQPHDLSVALLTPPSVLTAISHESYRVSYHPRRFGGMDTDPLAGHMLPGSRCPRLEWMENPARTRPMVDVVRDASEFARQFLRTGKGSATAGTVQHQPIADDAPAPTNGGEAPQRTDAEVRLAFLLKKQSELAEDPAREAEYHDVVAAIARAQEEVAGEQRIGAQGHG
jgi:hypothetical protein